MSTLSRRLPSLLTSILSNNHLPSVAFLHTSTTCNMPKPFDWKAVEVPPIRFQAQFPADGKYTSVPLHVKRTGGRNPATGRQVWRRIGGGAYRKHYWLEVHRTNFSDAETVDEKVVEIRKDRNRSGFIAMLAHKTEKRWVMATENLKVGSIVRGSRRLESIPIRAFEGDTHPVGSLPMGTLVSQIEAVPGGGQIFARAAGVCAQILRRVGDTIVLQLPSKKEVAVDPNCIATVGRIGNIDFCNQKWTKAGEARAEGRRPKSGLWHRKDGYCGRKIRPKPPVNDFTKGAPPDPTKMKMSRPADLRLFRRPVGTM